MSATTTSLTADTRRLNAPTAFGRVLFAESFDDTIVSATFTRPPCDVSTVVKRRPRGWGLFTGCVVSLAVGALLGCVCDATITRATATSSPLAHVSRAAITLGARADRGAATSKAEYGERVVTAKPRRPARRAAAVGASDLELSFRVSP